jgi:1-acyl-sn-glycerol-3-phosphate acyltransferase
VLTIRSAPLAAWGLYAWLLFAALLMLALLATILLPSLALRRKATRSIARWFFATAGLGFRAEGAGNLPQGPAVVVANHASYLDGPLLYAALPARFGFVIKKEIAGIPLVGRLLRRLGHEFVDRHNKAESAKDARRILRAAFGGGSVAFFPEGTFSERPGLAHFHSGAFVTAVRAGVPVVPVVIHGTRQALPSGTWLPRRAPLRVEVLEPLAAPPGADPMLQLRAATRARILERLGEPDLESS